MRRGPQLAINLRVKNQLSTNNCKQLTVDKRQLTIRLKTLEVFPARWTNVASRTCQLCPPGSFDLCVKRAVSHEEPAEVHAEDAEVILR
jgi:hypothetical protein